MLELEGSVLLDILFWITVTFITVLFFIDSFNKDRTNHPREKRDLGNYDDED